MDTGLFFIPCFSPFKLLHRNHKLASSLFPISWIPAFSRALIFRVVDLLFCLAGGFQQWLLGHAPAALFLNHTLLTIPTSYGDLPGQWGASIKLVYLPLQVFHMSSASTYRFLCCAIGRQGGDLFLSFFKCFKLFFLSKGTSGVGATGTSSFPGSVSLQGLWPEPRRWVLVPISWWTLIS